MASAVFAAALFSITVVLFASTVVREKRKISATREKIKNNFGSAEDTIRDPSQFENIPYLFNKLSKETAFGHIIDDITVSDLGLSDLYARVNRCVTSPGEDMLYCMFRIQGDDGVIRDYIRGFLKDPEKAVRLLYILDRYGRHKDCDDLEMILSLSRAKTKSTSLLLLPLAGLVLSVILISVLPVYGFAALIIMIVVCIWSYFAGKRDMDDNLRGLALALKLIACCKELLTEGCTEFTAFKDMFRLLNGKFLIPFKDKSAVDPLSILSDYVRMITHIDLIAYNIKVSGIKKYVDKLGMLYVMIGKTDAALALTSYLMKKKHCEAVLTDDCAIDAKAMYHPLVKNAVTNDLHSVRGMILTGSNASGKSTFLKATGINVLFAQSFGFAFADSFETGRFSVYTSMALADNLLGEESYYVVEARSIKRICDAAAKGLTLCIIDEVLRGTNTIERIAASSRILKSLCIPNVLCYAATHDVELARLLEDDMDLYHFTEEIHEDNVTFPFIIQKGYSEKTNAIRLLSMLGFGDDIVSSADALVASYRKTGKWVKEK